MWNPEKDTLVCKCGAEFGPNNVPEGVTGLLKPLKQQVELEAFQARELAEVLSLDPSKQKGWRDKHFGSEYPNDVELEELIEDFLYSTHRRDGCTATFNCPKCGRLALLHDVNEDWQFFQPESS